ncbi:uracil-DNA glycosylase family protein [Facklamia lactis]|nr:uracil-DNA glycosylase family protein [Facklamia lactis]
MRDELEQIYEEIISDAANRQYSDKGWKPVYTAGKEAKIALIGQAPGIKAQESHCPWNDASGKRLRQWMGINEETFYNPDQIALLPMDFYYPGKAKTGDKPPRKDFAVKWHPRILECLPNIELTLLVGAYAQKHYLKDKRKGTLTETVRAYQDYLPDFFPIVHPSPLNGRWLKKNPWFEEEVISELQGLIRFLIVERI